MTANGRWPDRFERQWNADGTGTAKGAIPLATLAPGNYMLQIVLMSGQGKDAVASQWIDFEIVP